MAGVLALLTGIANFFCGFRFLFLIKRFQIKVDEVGMNFALKVGESKIKEEYDEYDN